MHGQYEHSLDSKNRVTIPKSLRDTLADGLVLTRGYDPCICIYPPHQWQDLCERVKEMPRAHPDVRAFTRLYIASAFETTLDSMGRVLLPPYLRKHADIEKETVILGLGSTIEIWSLAQFKGQLEIDIEKAQSILDTVAKMGI